MTKYIAKQPDKHGFIDFNDEENKIWEILIKRQLDTIQDRACDEFIDGLKKLDLPTNKIPQCPELSEILQATTGFSVVPVAAMIPIKEFFQLIANRQFPAASFIRLREELDYLQEPDIFHEIFGHCPLLTHPAYADFVQWYGEIALKADKETQSFLGRLFWFTIEFGLINTPKGLRIYGGGILSSHQETIYALENKEPKRVPFDIPQTMATDYRYDKIQKLYFTLNKMDDLFEIQKQPILEFAKALTDGKPHTDFLIC